MEINATEIILAIIAVVAPVVTHILDKNKNKVEVDKLKVEVEKLRTEKDSDSIDNMDKSLEFYEKFVEATNKRLDEVLHNQSRLIEENNTLRAQVTEMDNRLSKVTSVICTKLTCVHREVDEEIMNCIYPQGNKPARKLARKTKKV